LRKTVEVVPMADEQYTRLLGKDFPDLRVENLKHIGSGYENVAALVNNQFVFRFSQHLFDDHEQLQKGNIKKQIDVLTALKGKLSLSIPELIYIAPDYSYFGYKILPGILWGNLPGSMVADVSFLRDWVDVRSEISSALSVAEAQRLGAGYYDISKDIGYAQKYLTDPNADGAVKKLVGQSLGIVEKDLPHKDTWKFIHEDLQPSNLLLNPDTHKITGVLDFEEAEIGPIEADFAAWAKTTDSTLEQVAKIQAERGTDVDIELAKALQRIYFISNYLEFTEKGYTETAQKKWDQLKVQADISHGQNWGEL